MRKQSYNRGQWQVQRERLGLGFQAPPPELPVREKLAEFIPDALRKMGMREQAWQQEIEARWPELAGAQIAENCRPGGYQQGCLTLYVTHPMWIAELKGNAERQLLERLQTEFGPRRIRSLRFELDPEDD